MERITLPLRRDQLENLIHLERESWDFCFQGCFFKPCRRVETSILSQLKKGLWGKRIFPQSIVRKEKY